MEPDSPEAQEPLLPIDPDSIDHFHGFETDETGRLRKVRWLSARYEQDLSGLGKPEEIEPGTCDGLRAADFRSP